MGVYKPMPNSSGSAPVPSVGPPVPDALEEEECKKSYDLDVLVVSILARWKLPNVPSTSATNGDSRPTPSSLSSLEDDEVVRDGICWKVRILQVRKGQKCWKKSAREGENGVRGVGKRARVPGWYLHHYILEKCMYVRYEWKIMGGGGGN